MTFNVGDRVRTLIDLPSAGHVSELDIRAGALGTLVAVVNTSLRSPFPVMGYCVVLDGSVDQQPVFVRPNDIEAAS